MYHVQMVRFSLYISLFQYYNDVIIQINHNVIEVIALYGPLKYGHIYKQNM